MARQDRYGDGSSGSVKREAGFKGAKAATVIDLCDSDSDSQQVAQIRHKRVKSEPAESSDYDSDDNNRRRASQPSLRLYAIARILTLATDLVESVSESETKLASVDSGILSRIKKSLALAKHAGTGEAEARQALRLATRLMSSQNLTQADLLASSDAEANQQRAGMSEVAILSQTGVVPRNESWVNQVAIAINLFFDVKAYSTSYDNRTKLSWTFYGLAVNTVAAAYAFEMVHNQVLTWAMEKADRKQISGKTGKNSYCQGVAAGLIALAKKEKKEELRIAARAEVKRLKQAEEQEKADRKKQTDRLDPPLKSESEHPALRGPKLEDVQDQDVKPFAVKRSASEEIDLGFDYESFGRNQEESDDDNEDQWHDTHDDPQDIKPHFDEADEPSIIDLTADASFPDIKPDIKPKLEPKEEPDQAQWHSSQQLIRFRQDAEKIADDFLASQNSGIKLKKRAKSTYKKDSHAFEQGRIDARKIDVKRKRIQN